MAAEPTSAVALWTHLYGDLRGLLAICSGVRPTDGSALKEFQTSYWRWPDEAAKALREVAQQVALAREVYFTAHLLTAANRRKAQATRIQCCWADDVNGDIPPELQPTALWATSAASRQAAWRLTEAIEARRAETLNKRFVRALAADPSGADLTQLLRPPGGVNFKYAARPTVHLLHLDAARAYDPDALERLLPPLGPGRPLAAVTVDAARIGEHHRNTTLTSLAGTMRRCGMTEAAICQALLVENTARCDPPLAEAEVATIAASVSRYAPEPAPPSDLPGAGRGHTAPPPPPANGTAGPGPRIQSAAELQACVFTAPRWAVPHVIPDGLTILAGKPKLGKSWQALGLAVAIATGGRAFGQIAVDAGDVLFLGLEDNERRLQRRLTTLLGDAPWPPRLALATTWPRLDEGGLALLDAYADAHPELRLIVTDTFKQIRPRGGRGALYDEDYAALEPLHAWAQRRSLAVLVILHCRKAAADDVLDTVTGTMGLTGAADTIAVLQRARGAPDAVLHISGRDLEDDLQLALRWDRLTCAWVCLGDAAEFALSPERLHLLELLRAHGPLTPTQAADLLAQPANRVKRLLWLMAREGQLKAAGGTYAPLSEREKRERE
jgi:hypothetical protein